MAHPRDLTSVTPDQMAVLDGLIPAVWPEVWHDFARVFFLGLLNAGEVTAPIEALARTALEQVRTLGFQLGGSQPYIPRGTHLARAEAAEAICREFRGKNHGELAAKYGISESRVRGVLSEAKQRRSFKAF